MSRITIKTPTLQNLIYSSFFVIIKIGLQKYKKIDYGNALQSVQRIKTIFVFLLDELSSPHHPQNHLWRDGHFGNSAKASTDVLQAGAQQIDFVVDNQEAVVVAVR